MELGTEEMEQETVETLDDFSNPMPGQPCERPEEAGWNLQNVTDVRNDFFRLPLEPEEEKKDATYLLGKTENYTLYGKGDYETMLLECGGKYSEITYFYASNYMDPLQLFETDIDYDGQTELAIKFRLQKGNGISIDTFLLADFGKDNELYVHQYLAEEFAKQLAEALEFEKTEDGVQAKVNGKNAGPMMENMEGRGAFHEAGVGAIMHFYYDNVENEIRLSGDILFFADGVTYETNGNDVTSKVNWDGEKFFLSDFTSRNRYLEEQVEGDLSQFYGRNLYDVNVHYDASKMNQETMVISAEVLKTEADRNYEDVEIQLKQAKDSYVSGWEMEGILSKSPRSHKANITFIIEGMKEEIPAVLYRGNGYSIYIPEEDWQVTGIDSWEAVKNENVKLQIRDYDKETVETIQQQLFEEGYSLDDLGELTKYDSEKALIQKVRIFTHNYNKEAKGVFYSYPMEAEEDFGIRLKRIVSTFGWENLTTDYILKNMNMDIDSETQWKLVDKQSGIENYNKAKIIEGYGKDIDSGLFLFPNKTEKMIEATFASNLKTGFFDTDGYIILQAKYNVEDYEAEVERLSNVECTVRDEVLGVRYDTESYALPAYVAVDGFDYVYEYALIDQNNCKITYVLLSYPEDVDLNKYEEYLKLDRTEYTVEDTLKCFSIYVHQSKNNVYIEYSE